MWMYLNVYAVCACEDNNLNVAYGEIKWKIVHYIVIVSVTKIIAAVLFVRFRCQKYRWIHNKGIDVLKSSTVVKCFEIAFKLFKTISMRITSLKLTVETMQLKFDAFFIGGVVTYGRPQNKPSNLHVRITSQLFTANQAQRTMDISTDM